MSANTILNATTVVGGDVIRNIDKSGVKTQVVAIDLGGAGAESLLTGTLPVSGPVTDAQLRATAVPVSGPLTNTQLRAANVDVTNYPANSFGDLTADAWGIQKMSLPYSLFHGM